MPHEIVVALQVDDPEVYARYRAEIAPLLESAGAGFRFDFEVARTLKNASQHAVNRVFVLSFPDRLARERFFADERYREIRGRLFEASVGGATIIAEHDF